MIDDLQIGWSRLGTYALQVLSGASGPEHDGTSSIRQRPRNSIEPCPALLSARVCLHHHESHLDKYILLSLSLHPVYQPVRFYVLSLTGYFLNPDGASR